MITRYKHIQGPDLPYMVSVMQPRLMKRIASFLLASGPTWKPPPPPLSQLPHSHLYPSSRRFLVVPTLTFGLSHKIPNGTSVTLGLHRYNTVISGITSGLRSKGQVMYYPMLHLDSSLGTGEATNGVLPTSQAFF
jgi:hypothetical protein